MTKDEAIRILEKSCPKRPQKLWSIRRKEAVKMAIEALSAQPEIVRCKDCKHYNAGFECLIEGYGIEREPNWFCGDGKRKDGDADDETGSD